MPDQTCTGITTSAHSIGNTQDGCAKLATGTKEILTTLSQIYNYNRYMERTNTQRSR